MSPMACLFYWLVINKNQYNRNMTRNPAKITKFYNWMKKVLVLIYFSSNQIETFQ